MTSRAARSRNFLTWPLGALLLILAIVSMVGDRTVGEPPAGTAPPRRLLQFPDQRSSVLVTISLGIIVGTVTWTLCGLTPMSDLARFVTGGLAFISTLLAMLTFSTFTKPVQQIVAVVESLAVIGLGIWAAAL